MTKAASAIAVLCLCASIIPDASAQRTSSGLSEAEPPEMPLLYHLFKLLMPQGIRTGYLVREYIASNDLLIDSAVATHRQAVDDIYAFALKMNHWSHTSAMLATAFGTFDHDRVTLDFGLRITLPLTSESEARFLERHENLPTFLYEHGVDDRDKLQHFFASGWLKRAVGIEWIARVLGSLVETLEGAFVSGGADDPRDRKTNRDGIRFAGSVGNSLWVAPSAYFRED